MKKVGIWLAHPKYPESLANKFITQQLLNHPSVNLRHIDLEYQDSPINQYIEHQLIKEVDTIVLQFPIFWYAPPSSMQRWLEEVFSLDLLQNANPFKGKDIVISVTTGSSSDSYSQYNRNHHSIKEYLISFQQIAYLFQMNYKGIVCTHGINKETPKKIQEKNLSEHVEKIENILSLKREVIPSGFY